MISKDRLKLSVATFVVQTMIDVPYRITEKLESIFE